MRRAAQRKLDHELGIPPEQVPLDEFQFLTRIHYLAPSDGLWGEHESELIAVLVSHPLRHPLIFLVSSSLLSPLFAVDYILFITAPVTIEPNMNEVCDVKWVSPAELQDLMTNLDRECLYIITTYNVQCCSWG